MPRAWRIPALLLVVSVAWPALGTASVSAAEPTRAIVWERTAAKRKAAIWIAAADGTGARRLAGGELPDISPDGRWVAYVVTGRDKSKLFVIPSSGGARRLVHTIEEDPEFDGEFSFDWSSDSARLAFGADSTESPLLATYDVMAGRRGPAVDFVRPRDVEFVPGSNQVAAIAQHQGFNHQLLLMTSDDGSVRTLTEITDDLAGILVASAGAVAFHTFSLIDVLRNPFVVLGSSGFKLNATDIASGRTRTLGQAVRALDWRPDGRTLDVVRATCTPSRCDAGAGTLDADTGAVVQAIPTGWTSFNRHKVRRKGRRPARVEYVLKADALEVLAFAADGRSLLGGQVRGEWRGRDFDEITSRSASVRNPLILRVPLDGGKPMPVARGTTADWNL